jgi:predicted nucleic acid-binding protein
MNVADLPGLVFLDTNVLVYSFDASAPEKQQTAHKIVHSALLTQRGVISTQVVQEFLNLALRKFVQPLSMTDAREYLQTVLMPLCQHFPNMAFYDHALLIQQETGYSLYDALIVTAAVELNSTVLLSEDLQDGRIVHGVRIANPFVSP